MKKLISTALLLVMFVCANAQHVTNTSSSRAANPNEVVGKALVSTGAVSTAFGLACVTAGAVCLLCADGLPNPTKGYTTSQALATQDPKLEYMPTDQYVSKLEEYNGKKLTINNTGCILTGAGAALTIVGIPIYCYGRQLMNININYTGNGAGVAVNF